MPSIPLLGFACGACFTPREAPEGGGQGRVTPKRDACSGGGVGLSAHRGSHGSPKIRSRAVAADLPTDSKGPDSHWEAHGILYENGPPSGQPDSRLPVRRPRTRARAHGRARGGRGTGGVATGSPSWRSKGVELLACARPARATAEGQNPNRGWRELPSLACLCLRMAFLIHKKRASSRGELSPSGGCMRAGQPFPQAAGEGTDPPPLGRTQPKRHTMGSHLGSPV